ncbi:hypothetical protein B0H11DRAFT_2240344 [Mycena galericulata]|nr:hypothetical protein B0H11DRAFT_2240344 [Mycena galericulata]
MTSWGSIQNSADIMLQLEDESNEDIEEADKDTSLTTTSFGGTRRIDGSGSFYADGKLDRKGLCVEGAVYMDLELESTLGAEVGGQGTQGRGELETGPVTIWFGESEASLCDIFEGCGVMRRVIRRIAKALGGGNGNGGGAGDPVLNQIIIERAAKLAIGEILKSNICRIREKKENDKVASEDDDNDDLVPETTREREHFEEAMKFARCSVLDQDTPHYKTC